MFKEMESKETVEQEMGFDGEGEGEGDENIVQVGNFLIDEGRILGEGAFGQVFLCQEIPDDYDMSVIGGGSK